MSLAYAVDGPADAPVLLLGNSLGTTTAMWEPQLAALSERFRLVRYDHRGHGASPVPAGSYTLDQLGADVLALLDTLGLQRIHAGGLSLGGMVAMWLAANAPERVDRLVLLCTSAKLGPPEMWQQRAESVRQGGMDAIADLMVTRWFTADFVGRQPDVVAWARKLLTDTSPDGYVGCCAAVETMDLLPALGSITAPTLVIAGANDLATPAEHARRIVAGIQGAELVVVPDAAHLANVEQPDVVTALMLKFLGGRA
jgi:3-oxoadipate enol-lactonase